MDEPDRAVEHVVWSVGTGL